MMIDSSKFSMQFDSSLVVGKGGLLGSCKEADMVGFSIGLDACSKGTERISLVEENASESYPAILSHFGVHPVLRPSRESEVRPPIIEVVPVDMIDPSIGRRVHNDASHIKLPPIFSAPDHSGGPAFFSEIPLPLVEPIEVRIIDNSKLSFGQRNFPHDHILPERD